MCVAALAWEAHPRWKLIAIGNRDEYHDRPAAPLAQWVDHQGIIAGRDLKSGGTWLGVSEAGRFALVTNLRGYGDTDPSRASRGALVTDWLAGEGQYSDPVSANLMDFNPFNLFLADAEEARFLSNRPEVLRTSLAHGIYGLSNGVLDEPWPKTLQIKAGLLDWLNRNSDGLEDMFTILENDTLPDVGVHTTQPSDVKREAPETPIFIRDPIYGTRCSTIVAVEHDGSGRILERRFSSAGKVTGETSLSFRWPA